MELDEKRQDALVRELREELGIEVSHLETDPFRTIAGEDFRLAVWIVTRWTGTSTNRATEEHDELRWVGLDGLNGLTLAHSSLCVLLLDALSVVDMERRPM